jgi:hypothetical protein
VRFVCFVLLLLAAATNVLIEPILPVFVSDEGDGEVQFFDVGHVKIKLSFKIIVIGGRQMLFL